MDTVTAIGLDGGLFLIKEIHPRLSLRSKNKRWVQLTLYRRHDEDRFLPVETRATYWGLGSKQKFPYEAGDLVKITGTAEPFFETYSINIDKIEAVEVNRQTLRQVLPVGPFPRGSITGNLRRLISTVKDEELKDFGVYIHSDQRFMDKFSFCPGSLYGHHAYIGGLIHHTYSQMQMVGHKYTHYNEQLRWRGARFINRDYLLLGAFLADVGKVFTYLYNGMFELSEKGKAVSHVEAGLEWVKMMSHDVELSEDKLHRLQHIISAHHAPSERVRSVEARMVATTDREDSELNAIWLDSVENAGEEETSGNRTESSFDNSFAEIEPREHPFTDIVAEDTKPVDKNLALQLE